MEKATAVSVPGMMFEPLEAKEDALVTVVPMGTRVVEMTVESAGQLLTPGEQEITVVMAVL